MYDFSSFIQYLDKTNQSRLKKLKIDNLLSLIITHAPKSYTDTTLTPTLILHSNVLIKVCIHDLKMLGFGKNARLSIDATMSDFNQPLEMIIFHPKPFHKKIFSKDSIHYVLGKLESYNQHYTLIQPKSIKHINTITPHFKTTLLSAKAMQSLTQAAITMENLLSCGIPHTTAQKIYDIFMPSSHFMLAFKECNALPQAHLNALKFVEIYHYLHLLSRKKIHFNAKYRCDNDITPFIESLPFSLTHGQYAAIQDIRLDLDSQIAARRLIMGDVGCGKTIIILCAVMMTYPHTSILMAPTTILATQLYEEAKRLLPPFIKIHLITAKTHQDSQEAHFIIGTQALLYRELTLENVALVMSDEQHRFGTNQRYGLEKIGQDAQKKARPHILQFSATPIPRTLAMINAQFIHLSVIQDLPFKKDISTSIVDKSTFKTMLYALQNEINKGHQAIIIYPLVEESEHLNYLSLSEGLSFWQKHFENVYFTSGKDKNKQNIIDEFARNGSLLLATTLVEVGISLPKVSTIVIVAPERLGLATLHQLRGRVSRNGLKGYCYLYTHQPNNERLKAFCNTLSGFDIAELDLKYRNSGDILSGERQSGDEFIYFDMGSDEHILKEAQALIQRQNTQKE
ncbi:ATP-dependent DNA helicase RecG [Helicobacter sp. MIT 21-1697]|uniref:ATP-dependent DNA helicase RecG n=1 Tax=Helicobacter sp. MIT 21-1697 TaxID=2993733 RepID=UPI00224AD342|nr:ATP-dependent DNA helicase RecG [Helicobacter sp. MIT 21-1697]MCX2717051.1 ATP-dependent DNA helicase RecG [Helicobacter sp. MIT 21-1697]